MPKTPAELLLAPWSLDRARHVMRRSDGNQFTNDSRMDDDERQVLVDAVNAGCSVLETTGKDNLDKEEIQNVRDMVLGGGDLPGSKPEESRRALAYLDGIEARIEALRSEAFELGVKSADGSIIPDHSKFVELALDRDQIDILGRLADTVIVDDTRGHDAESVPALLRFLEVISIHRRKS